MHILETSLEKSIDTIKRISGGSSDVLINRFVTGGISCALICCEGMVSASVITELIFEPVTDIPQKKYAPELFHYISEELLLSTDRPPGKGLYCTFPPDTFGICGAYR